MEAFTCSWARRCVPLVLAALAFVASGCEDEVDPTLGTDQAFSLYGYLDPTASQQAIRVVPVASSLDADPSAPLDITITSTDLATGQTATWRDSLVTFLDGTVGHVYVADTTPTSGAQVELQVRGPDATAIDVQVPVPPLARARLEGTDTSEGGVDYIVSVTDVPRIIAGRLRLFVTGMPGAPADTTALTVSIDELPIRNEGSQWLITVPFLDAVRQYLSEAGLSSAGLRLLQVEFSPFVANSEWDVGSLGDDALVEPGTFSNVSGGFGFIGAGYESPVRWVPSVGTQARAGFAVDQDPASLVKVNEVGVTFVELYNPTTEPVSVAGYVVSLGGADEGVTITGVGVIPSRGFLVVDVPFTADQVGDVVTLFNSQNQFVALTVVDVDVDADVEADPKRAEGVSFGSYPDGHSYGVRVDELGVLFPGSPPFRYQLTQHDLFKAPMPQTPGAPNRPGAAVAVINEVQTGSGGVEILALSPAFEQAYVFSAEVDAPFGVRAAPTSGSYLLARPGGSLDLPSSGGDAYLIAVFNGETEGLRAGVQAVDARSLGPQDPARSSGYLPDGPSGAWTPGLSPTLGSPNVPSGASPVPSDRNAR